MAQEETILSFEEMEKALLDCVKDGFISFSLEERRKILQEQENKSKKIERRFNLSQKQKLRQFSL